MNSFQAKNREIIHLYSSIRFIKQMFLEEPEILNEPEINTTTNSNTTFEDLLKEQDDEIAILKDTLQELKIQLIDEYKKTKPDLLYELLKRE